MTPDAGTNDAHAKALQINLDRSIYHAADLSADAQTSDDAEVLARVANMTALAPAVVSNFAQRYLLVEYFRRFTAEPMRLVLGVWTLAQLMQREFYEALPGNLLEGLRNLLAANVKGVGLPNAGGGVLRGTFSFPARPRAV